MKRLCLQILLLTSYFLLSHAYQTHYYGAGKLSSSRVKCIAEDRQGFVWIATENGLNKFDGWRFTTYFHHDDDTTSLASNNVERLFYDRQDRLWVGSTLGLQEYVPYLNAFMNVRFTDGAHPSVLSTTESHDGSLFVATPGYGVYKVNRDTRTAEPQQWINTRSGTKFMHQVFEDSRRRLWVALPEARVISFDTKRRTVYSAKPATGEMKVTKFIEDNAHRLWLSTTTAVYRWNEARRTFDRLTVEGGDKLEISGMTLTQSGVVFVATKGQGLRRIDPATGTVRAAQTTAGRDTDFLLAIKEGRQRVLWAGYYLKGLAMFSHEGETFRFAPNDTFTQPTARATALAETGDGSVYAAYGTPTLYRFDNTLRLTRTYTLPRPTIMVFQSRSGQVYTGYYGGLALFNPATGTAQGLPPFDGYNCNAMAEGSDGTLYVSLNGTGFGVYNPRTKALRVITGQQGLHNAWGNAMLVDRQGLVWMAHCFGVDVYNPKTGRLLDLAADTRGQQAYALLEDWQGHIWIGTHCGLYEYDKATGATHLYSTTDGLPSDVICSLFQAQNGDIWYSTFNGMCRIAAKSHKMMPYIGGTGLTDREYLLAAGCQRAGGAITVAGVKGLTRFNPDAVHSIRQPARPRLMHVYFGDQEVAPAELSDSIWQTTTRLNIPQGTSAFALEFAIPDVVTTENVRFEYRITDRDDAWQQTELGDNHIDFSYLAPGSYTLEVRANKFGNRSEIATYTLHIAAPWYATPVARVIFLLLAIALLWYAYRLWRELQRGQQQRLINEERTKFFINVAHDLRSPMTLIISPLATLLRTETDDIRRRALLTIQHNADRILKLTNQILDIRRIEKQQLTLQCRETDLVVWTEALFQLFDYQAQKRGIAFTYRHDTEYLPAWINGDQFDKVLVNMLSNAFKYTPDGGEITLALTTTPDRVLITVTDSGPGIPPDKLTDIFERFYQAPQAKQGYGIGLNLTQMLVHLHHGTITAANRTDGQTGAVFTVALPLGREHLAAGEIASPTQQDEQPAERQALRDETFWETADDAPDTPQKSKTAYRVLIVDDDQEMRDYIAQELGVYYRVLTAADGAEAYKRALEEKVDVIVSDVVMPRMDGFELLRQVKGNNNISHVPFVLLTTKSDCDSRIQGWSTGADAFLAKPFNVEELHTVCESLIAGRHNLRGRYSIDQRVDQRLTPLEVKANDEVFMEKLMKAVNQNISNSDFTVEDLAAAVGVSRVQLHRKLKALAGNTTTEFIRNIRLKQAARLLKEHKVNISQTAYAVGFSNPTLFSITFKKQYGCTPSEYAAREKQD